MRTLTTHIRTEKSNYRATNDDAAAAIELDEGSYLLTVADGNDGWTDGHRPGGRAAIELLGSSLRDHLGDDPILALEKIVSAANAAMYRTVKEDQDPWTDPVSAASMTSMYTKSGVAYIAQVGDTRAYLLRAGVLTQLTTDQTLISLILRGGRYSEAEASRVPLSNVILSCLGAQATVAPELLSIELREGDRLLLCTDGIWRYVSDSEIAEYLAAENLKDGCDRIVEAALREGHDNATALVGAVIGQWVDAGDELAVTVHTDPLQDQLEKYPIEQLFLPPAIQAPVSEPEHRTSHIRLVVGLGLLLLAIATYLLSQ